MDKGRNSKTKLILGAAALVILAIAFFLVYQAFRPDKTEGQKTITVQVIHGDESSKDFIYHTDAQLLGDVLKAEELIAGTDGPYGLYMLTVDGETVDEAKQQWWKLTQNGELSNYSADQLPIEDGGHYELTFTTGWD